MAAVSAVIRGISEDDFTALADAANASLERGDRELAERLDCMARKANAALSRANSADLLLPGLSTATINWRDVPSTLLKGAKA